MEIPTGLGITRRIGEEKAAFLLKFLGKMPNKWETIAVALTELWFLWKVGTLTPMKFQLTSQHLSSRSRGDGCSWPIWWQPLTINIMESWWDMHQRMGRRDTSACKLQSIKHCAGMMIQKLVSGCFWRPITVCKKFHKESVRESSSYQSMSILIVLVGCLELALFSINGMSSFPLTNSIIFQGG